MKRINENIKKFRLDLGLTQQEVADKLFVTRQCISRWEQGKSVPDIDSLEKIASILKVTVNDILDDESIKTLTINEAIKNNKNKKYIWSSIIISILAVLLTIVGYKLISDQYKKHENIQTENIKSTRAEVTKFEVIKKDLGDYKTTEYIIGFKNEEFNMTMNYPSSIYDIEKEETIGDHPLKVGDIIEIEYQNELKLETITKISLIDSKVEKSLLGVIIVANGETYDSIDDLPTDSSHQGLYYYLEEYNRSRTNIGLGNRKFNYSNKDSYYYYEHELYFYLDRTKFKNEIKIGLVYSTGIEYVETIDKFSHFEYQRTFTGELDYKVPEPAYYVHSRDVTYKVNLIDTQSISSIEINEYDRNHQLIKTSTLNNFDNYWSFKGDENAIYSYFNVTYSGKSLISDGYDYIYRKVYQLNVGESIDLELCDDYGLVYKTKFYYSSR